MPSSVAEILIAQGRLAADERARSGERRGALISSLGAIPGQVMADRQAQQEHQLRLQAAADERRRREQADARAAAAEGRAVNDDVRERDLATQTTQINDAIAAGFNPETGAFDQTRAFLHADQAGYVGIKPAIAKWARENRPPAPPTPIQRDPTKDLMQPDGTVISHGVPEVPKVTFGTPQRVTINGRLTTARPGSDDNWYIGGKQVAGTVELYEKPAAAPSDNEPLETIIGPDGKPVRVRRRDAVGKAPASGTEKASSGVQKRVLNFFNRAQQADVDLESMEAEILKLGAAGQARMDYAPNALQSDVGQRYTQAQRMFTEARLRKDSGAAIPKEEFESDKRTYFPQFGDSPATLEQKRRGRAAMLASLGFESGQALGEFMGDADEARALVESYKARSKKPETPKAGATVTLPGGPKVGDTKTFPNGRRGRWDGDGWEPIP